MSQKAQYKTKQLSILDEYLKSVAGQHITVNEISQHFKNQGISVGTTTIYRHLEKMVANGTVAKYVMEGTNCAYFEYLSRDSSCHQPTCFHLKCEKCGKLTHLHCEHMQNLLSHISLNHGFKVDEIRTIFYGTCENCVKNQNKQE